jgi:AcrR family transcriptional regulator
MTHSDLPRPGRLSTARNASHDGAAARLTHAAIEAVAEQGFAGLTVDGLCGRASTTRSEFDHHWSDPGDVLRDALDELMRLPQVPDLGSLPDDLAAYVEAYLTRCSDPAFRACVFYVMANAKSDRRLGPRLLSDFIHRRIGNRILIARAVTRGDLPAGTDPDPILDGALKLAFSWMSSGNTPSPKRMKADIRGLLAQEARRRERSQSK